MSITDELRDYIKEQQWCAKGMLTAIADRIDAALVEHYVELPKDADGEPIHVGDVMDYMGKMTVDAIDGHNVFFFADNWADGVYCVHASELRHHHAPTVEDVLREMADRCYADEDEPRDRDAIVAEYAAKLQLRGDVE